MRKVIVLGGGLAGLVCARALATAGMRVEVWEKADHFGGKAGSTFQEDEEGEGGRWVDHGFHIFPAWYLNTQRLLCDLGIELWESKDFYEVSPWELRDEPGGRPIQHRIFDRTMVASLDLVSRSPSYLADLSLHAFLRGRIYTGQSSANRLQEISRKALGSPAYLSSAETMQHNLQWWLPVFKENNWNALRGPMQKTFIEPLERAAEMAGATLHRCRAVTGIELRDGRIVPIAEGVPPEEDAIVVSALPVDVLKELAQRSPEALELLVKNNLRLKDVQHLDTVPLAALDLHLNRRLPELPRGHFILRGSRYELTGIDITGIWPEYDGGDHPTVLQLVAGDTVEIRYLTAAAFKERLIAEVQRYFRFDRDEVDDDHTTAMTHLKAQLFANNVGSNSKRVEPTETGVEDLYLIGDHTATPVDLACMEGAVYSALIAARHICVKAGVPAPELIEMRQFSLPIRVLLKVARYPLSVLALPLRLIEPWYAVRNWRLRRALSV